MSFKYSLVLLYVLVIVTTSTSNAAIGVRDIVKPEKSYSDDREYRIFTLANELQVIIVSDPKADKAGASLDVHVGHFSDPEDVPGIAHFLEHMLFLGTKKYPEEASYNKWLAEHGGTANAFTSTEDTNYMFEVGSSYLEGTLDRFAQFFIAPLFTETATMREMNAVDSEHSKNLQSDSRRLYQLLKSTSNSIHPYHKFGTGNLDTLLRIPQAKGIDVRKKLLDFYSTYYSANIMKLAIVGTESLDQLETMVRTYFSEIPNRAVPVPTFNGRPFDRDQLQKQLHIVPVKDMDVLRVHFPFSQSVFPYYKNQPVEYISHLIGHEGVGSILSVLKQKNWASQLSAGLGSQGTDFALFSITAYLTEEGLDHVEEIISLILQYIQLVKKEGISQTIFDELKALAAIKFRFLDKTRPFDYTTSLSTNLQHFSPEDVLSGEFLFRDWNPGLMTQLVQDLSPGNMRFDVVSRKFEGQTDQTEKWYGTEYTEMDFTSAQREKWKNLTGEQFNLSLPLPNEFIPTDFTIKTADTSKNPVIVKEDDSVRSWHQFDISFNRPQANWYLSLRSPVANESPESTLLSSLFISMYQDSINEVLYPARLAGLSYRFGVSLQGLEVGVSGFNQKQPILLQKIFSGMTNFVNVLGVDSPFQRFKEELVKNIMNYKYQDPYTHAMGTVTAICTAPYWRPDELMKVVESITLENLVEFIPRLLSSMHVETFAHGNVESQEAVDIVSTLKSQLLFKPLFPSQIPHPRVVQLPDGSNFVYAQLGLDPENINSAVEVYYQVDCTDLYSGVLVDLVGNMLYQPFFDQLRTAEQLGYVASAGARKMYNVNGYRFIVQSSTKSADYLDDRISTFIETTWKKFLEKMSPTEWEQHVQSLILLLQEKPKNLAEKSSKYWKLITNKEIWNKTEEQVAILSKLKLEEVVRFSDEFLSSNSPNKKRLSSQTFGKGHNLQLATTEAAIASIDDFKLSLPLMPPFPHLNKKGPPSPPPPTTKPTTAEPEITTEPEIAGFLQTYENLIYIIVAQSIAIAVGLILGAVLFWKWKKIPKRKSKWVQLQATD